MQDIYITAPIGQLDSAQVQKQINPNLTAPIQKGQTVGQLIIHFANNTTQTVPLVALQDDPKGGSFRHVSDGVAHKFHQLFGGS